ncbi:dCTP deaminase [Caballeronia arationis]|jgi:dCTP deaminase|uniref:dCTP deaminase n=2 Tax=Caballeronia arationis TaxID=1777142 RepID=A0A7Z7IC56_9BURK|nr:dCTP deaminase [Caballeronia arationis]SOE87976.1 dCTP deaminase [Caballeronia arationis]
MSIKSDAWIKRMCSAPDGVILNGFTSIYLHKTDDGEWVTRDNGVAAEHYSGELVLLTPDEKKTWMQVHGAMIEPFESGQVRSKVTSTPGLVGSDASIVTHVESKIISYGTSSYGYDVRLGTKFKIFSNINSAVIDPLAMSDACYVDYEGETCVIPPNSYVLGHTVETFRLPRDVLAICVGKSTYARAGCAINVTPIEPGFVGQVVIEIANQTPLPMKVHGNQGIAQFLFLQSDEQCDVSYEDRAGKYQNQRGITTARV